MRRMSAITRGLRPRNGDDKDAGCRASRADAGVARPPWHVPTSGAPPMKRKLSIGSWAYIFNQEKPTTDFHQVVHMLHDLGYEGVELGSFGVHPTPVSHPTKADRQRLKKEVADHGLQFSGIAVDLWSFKKPGPSILDENPVPYMAAFLGFTAFAADLGIQTIRVDTVESPNFFETTGKDIDPKAGMDRLISVWDKCSKIA